MAGHAGAGASPAGPRPRLVASAVDLLLVATLALVGLALLGRGGDPVPWEAAAAVLLLASALPTHLVAVATGRSVGKLLLGLTLAPPGDPQPSTRQLLVRWAAKWLLPALVLVTGLPPGWAALVWVVDGTPLLLPGRRAPGAGPVSRRALHDLAAGTRVWAPAHRP